MRLVIMLLSSLAFVASGCSQGTGENSNQSTTESVQDQKGVYRTVDVAAFEAALNEGEVQLVDVRTPGECANGVIEGAENINIGDSDFDQQLEKLDKDKPVLVYCASGGRSARAMNMMKSKGFEKVLNLKGGYGAWVKHE
ncbi:rhodanese-like domain-containing protein [Halocola ammonii]